MALDLQALRDLFPSRPPFTALLVDEHGVIRFCIGELAGCGVSDLEGRNFLELVTPRHSREAAIALADAVSPRLSHVIEVPLSSGFRPARWYSLHLMPLREPVAGASVAIVAVDVTERRRELERLERAHRVLLQSQKVAHFGTWEWDLEDPHASWSEELYRIYGVPPDHVASYQDYLTRVHPEDRERVRAATERAVADRQPYSHDERVYRPDGELRYLHTWAEPVLDEHGKLTGLFGVCQDVTDQKLSELERDRLLQSEREAHVAAERAHRSARLVSEVSRVLASSPLQLGGARQAALRLLAGDAAQWAVLTVQHEGELVASVGHQDRGEESRARRVLHRRPMEPEADFGPAKVMRTGESLLLPEVPSPPPPGEPLFEVAAQGQAPITSYLCVPAISSGRPLGALTLARTGGPPYGEEDLLLAESLGFRFGALLAIDRHLDLAEEAVRVRDEFLSVASHELRTPLTTIKIQVEHLVRQAQQGAEISGTQVEQLGTTLLRQVNRLAKLTEQMLEVSRLRKGLPLALEKGELAGLVRSAASQLAEDARRSGCELSVRAAGPVEGRWDLGRMQQVFVNLIGNALKYGARRPVEIVIEPTQNGGRVSVTDHGIGVAERDAERIFAPFERAASVRHYGGLGLGLFFSRRIVEAHGGTIHVRSSAGQGTTFVVELPIIAESATLITDPESMALH